MTATVARITSGPIDPDLEAALPRLAMRARRLRQVESIMRVSGVPYHQIAAIRTERGEIAAEFTAAAEKLSLPGDRPGRALLLLVEEADRLLAASKRRPSLAQVLDRLRAIQGAAERDLSTAECDAIEARGVERDARVRAAAGVDAVSYLEACR